MHNFRDNFLKIGFGVNLTQQFPEKSWWVWTKPFQGNQMQWARNFEEKIRSYWNYSDFVNESGRFNLRR